MRPEKRKASRSGAATIVSGITGCGRQNESQHSGIDKCGQDQGPRPICYVQVPDPRKPPQSFGGGSRGGPNFAVSLLNWGCGQKHKTKKNEINTDREYTQLLKKLQFKDPTALAAFGVWRGPTHGGPGASAGEPRPSEKSGRQNGRASILERPRSIPEPFPEASSAIYHVTFSPTHRRNTICRAENASSKALGTGGGSFNHLPSVSISL